MDNMGLIILAGGKSTRMGQDKSFLKLGEGTLIEYIINKTAHFGFKELLIVTNKREKYSFLDVRIVEDFYPGWGPLAGIHAGLVNSKWDYNFVLPCDMPFFPINFIGDLQKNIGKYQAIVPIMGRKFQPLAAIYHRSCIKPIEKLLNNGENQVIKLYDLVDTCYLEMAEDNIGFININTPEDFVLAKKYLEGDIKDGKSQCS